MTTARLKPLRGKRPYVEVTSVIKAEMHRQGVSQTELAKRMKISVARVSIMLSGRGNLTVKTIGRIGKALNTTFVMKAVRK